LGIFIYFSISLASAITCTDSFPSSQETIQICGYCYENDGSPCLGIRECNITIYYPNGTIYVNDTPAHNNDDGSITYNITNETLPNGNYFGILNCGERSKDDFSFLIYTPAGKTNYGSGRPYILRTEIDDKIENFLKEQEEKNINRIPKDVERYIDYVAIKISPNNKDTGKFIVYVLILILLFGKELFGLIKKIKLKRKF
jgi:hypothetical protein